MAQDAVNTGLWRCAVIPEERLWRVGWAASHCLVYRSGAKEGDTGLSFEFTESWVARIKIFGGDARLCISIYMGWS